jgi:lipoyl(octanoyl) transferase
VNEIVNKKITFEDIGRKEYKEAWDYQESLHKKIVEIKLANRQCPPGQQQATPNYLLFCEHPHVYTLGKSGDLSNLLLDESGLKEKEANFYQINRGGDITYHGPGQIVGYPIIDLDNYFTDIHVYLRRLEEMAILTCKEFGLDAGRIEGLTGVWLDYRGKGLPRKICAIGVRSSHWVTMHGFAFNVSTDLSYFSHIVPCGISDKAVTSLESELGRTIGLPEVKECLKRHLAHLFESQIVEAKNEKGYHQV